MMNIKKIATLAFTFLFIFSFSVYAQLYDYQGSADRTRSTGYGADTMFVFFSGNSSKELAATHSTGDTSEFLWKRFNKSTRAFDSLLVHNGILSRLGIDSLYQNNYLGDAVEGLRVEILSDEDSLETYNGWVILDTLPDFGEIHIDEDNYNCESLWLWLNKFDLKDYVYYNLADTPILSRRIYNNRQVTWEASADVEIFDAETLYEHGDRFIGKIGTPFGMPYEDSDYYLEVSNVFGNSHSDTIFDVKAKAVKADFDVKKILEEGAVEDYSEDEVNEALLQVTFENNSENAMEYDWVGFNDSLNILRGRDSILWTSTDEDPLESAIEPYTPGKYAVRLTAKNDYDCVDSTTFYHIRVDSSKIDTAGIPNVFTPDGNEMNEYFVLPKKSNVSGGKRGVVSMKWVDVTVFNRSGELVYRFEGDPDQWQGWNGKVRNSNRDAAEGVYLYVIKGKGYDGVMHESKRYTGFLYLFRQ